MEEAIVRMLEELDPHSTYSDPEEVKRLNEPLQGNFDGIGIQFNMARDTLFVIQPVSGGPSEKVGILAGDRIIAVNDTVHCRREDEYGGNYAPSARTERLESNGEGGACAV